MDNINIPAWVGKAVYAFGIAAILGGSNLVVTNARDVAVLQSQQETEEKKLDRIEAKIDTLVERMHEHDSSN